MIDDDDPDLRQPKAWKPRLAQPPQFTSVLHNAQGSYLLNHAGTKIELLLTSGSASPRGS